MSDYTENHKLGDTIPFQLSGKGSALTNALGYSFDSKSSSGFASAEQLFSDDLHAAMQSVARMDDRTRSAVIDSVTEQHIVPQASLEEMLFDACAAVKIELSSVSMHFSQELRDKLSARIDSFHDPECWEEDESAIELHSIRTFVRWFYVTKPEKLPSFGMSNSGYLTASWVANGNRDQLTLEFCPRDKIRWLVVLDQDGQKEYGNGENTPLVRMKQILSGYPVEQWFNKS